MKFLSLFSGIGGLDLGLERAGMECVGQVENDDWCTKVLEKHWPDVPRWSDIHDIEPEDLPQADLICGGFPCQPVSYAGRRQAQDDPRWLWPQFARLVRGVRPRYVLVENVPGLASAGMGDVLGDLAAFGYDTEWESVPAAAVGAPHLRYRIFIVAYAAGMGWQGISQARERAAVGCSGQSARGGTTSGSEDVADTGSGRRSEVPPQSSNGEAGRRQGAGGEASSTQRSPIPGEFAGGGGVGATQMAAADGSRQRDGRSEPQRIAVSEQFASWWAVEPSVGRVADGIPRRVDRLRGLGNAVVPQVAEWVGRQIMAAHQGSLL